LLRRLYDYGNYRRRAMALILSQGALIQSRLVASWRTDVGIFSRLLWTCVVRASPRRAAMTIRIMAETALRRPRAFRRAVALALVHKHLYEYVHQVSSQLEHLIRELRARPDVGMLPHDGGTSEAI
jgi:hypothetical protein